MTVTLFGLLPDKYYVHCLLLIKGIQVLLADCISLKEVQQAENLLKKFCKLFEKYYGMYDYKISLLYNTYSYSLVHHTGVTHCGINFHLLLHLPFYVRNFGPLWTHSAFSFEGQMQNFLKYSHATHGIEKQV